MAYIEREKVLEIAKDKYYSDFHKSMADLTSLRELLEDTPAADVAPVVHGKWEYIGTDKTENVFRCSNCASRIGLDKETDYCPNCGAKMDGKDGE